MKASEINNIPEEIKNKKITKRQALNKLAVFIIKNYPMFGLHKYDEDFRSELILALLEKGEKMFDVYDPSLGDFFNYFYCHILNLIRTRAKILVRKNLHDDLTINECINDFNEIKDRYENMSNLTLEKTKKRNITENKLQDIFMSPELEDKSILLLAIKSSYYLDDEQINKICNHYSLNKNEFLEIIQQCKNHLEKKRLRRASFEERRNNAYFRHRKYNLEQEKNMYEPEYEKKEKLLIKKDRKQTANWHQLNEKLENGFMYLRPTNKFIANMLGLCERQVSYYLNSSKKIDKKEK